MINPGRTGGLSQLNLTKARWDEDIHCIIHANPKRGKLPPGWFAGTFEKADTGKLVFTSWSQILYSRRVQGNDPVAGGVLES